MKANILQALGLTNEDDVFKRAWTDHGVPSFTLGARETLTPTVDAMLANPESQKNWKGFARKSLSAMAKGEKAPVTKGAITSSDVTTVTPLVYDPEILALLKTEAPLLARLPTRGQRGFTAYYNKITARGGPIGFVSEATALDLSGQAGSESTYAQGSQAMKIWVDLVQISDFAQAGGEHYFDLRETELGQRLALYSQVKEEAILYGDPTLAKSDGSAFDTNAYTGLNKIFTTAGNNVDKTAVDISGADALAKDIKKEINKLLQGPNQISLGDLEIWTSHMMVDALENSFEVKRRFMPDQRGVEFGNLDIRIGGVPVIASHTVDAHTHSATTKGAKGDVFIINKRANEFRALAPLSTIPMARIGLAERVAMFEFGAFVNRADGQFGKVLQNYNI